MPRIDLFDVTVILDRSGSMASCRDDAEGGLNIFIEEQKKQPGETVFTLVQFDNTYEVVHRGVPVKGVPPHKLVPRGNTALYDAIGRTINEIGERLDKLPESDRPSLVTVVILTDGYENASQEFTQANVKEMIEHQQSKCNWQFTYLGANQNAFAVGGGMGVRPQACANYLDQNVGGAFAAASSNVARMKHAVMRGAGGQSVSAMNAYTDDERKAMSSDADEVQ